MKTIKATLLTFIGLALGATLAEAAEKSEAQKELLAKYDANKDGRLSTSEREKIRYDKLNPPKENNKVQSGGASVIPTPSLRSLTPTMTTNWTRRSSARHASGWIGGSRRSTRNTMSTRTAA